MSVADPNRSVRRLKSILSTFAVLFLVSAVLPLEARPVAAALFCGKRTAVLNFLRKSYGEQPRFRAVTLAGNVVEVLISKHRSWTIITTSPDGVSCLMSAGRYWEHVAVKPKGPAI